MRLLTVVVRSTLPVLLLAACDGGSPASPPAPPTVELSSATRTILTDGSMQVSATVREEDGSPSTRPVQWSSSDAAVANVDASGLVRGAGAGRAVITATVAGVSDTLSLTVMRAPPAGGPQSTFLAYTSTPGDYIGGGASARMDVDDGQWEVQWLPYPGVIRLEYDGAGGSWNLALAAPEGSALEVGTYEEATRWPFQEPAAPGLDFSGNGNGCNQLGGSFTIHDIAVDHEGRLHRLHASFRQHCEYFDAYLDGEVALLLQPLR